MGQLSVIQSVAQALSGPRENCSNSYVLSGQSVYYRLSNCFCLRVYSGSVPPVIGHDRAVYLAARAWGFIACCSLGSSYVGQDILAIGLPTRSPRDVTTPGSEWEMLAPWQRACWPG